MLRWIKRFFSGPKCSPPSNRGHKSLRRSVRLRLEPLEDRIVPATMWTVDTTSDTDAGDPTKDAGSLRWCVQNAVTGDTIVFSNLIANQTIQMNSPILLGQNGLTNLTIDGGTNNVSISGQGLTRLFEVASGSDTIKNLTLENGFVNNGGNGGAMLIDTGATLNLNKDNFLSNIAGANGPNLGNGGAIENDGTLTDNDSFFTENQAMGSGGAIANKGTLNETGSTFTSNGAPSGNGGAIESNSGGVFQVTVSNCFFYNNGAVSGGAIDTSDNTTLNNDTFGQAGQSNMAAGGAGGALRTTLSATLNTDDFVSNQAFANNGVGGNGGAIVNSGLLNVHDGFFENNTAAGAGGAIENDNVATIDNLTDFEKNTAGTNGGAIDSNSGSINGQLGILNTSFLANNAVNGGAINTTDNTMLTSDSFGNGMLGNANTASAAGGAVNATGGVNGATRLTVSNSLFNLNQVTNNAGTGGAINTDAITDVETSKFIGNLACQNGAGVGGAIAYKIFNQNDAKTPFSSSLTVNQDDFEQNWAGGKGGAISSMVTVDSGMIAVYVTNSTFFRNNVAGLAVQGGGLNIEHTANGTGNPSVSATLTNDTFFQNSAPSGGGIFMELATGITGTSTASLTSLTVTDNQATSDGGGVKIDAANKNVSVNNNIFDGNHVTAANYNGPLDVTLIPGTVLNDIGYNLVDPSDTMFTANTDIPNNMTGLAGALAANGAKPGYPQTLALSNTSPGYRKGNPNLAGTIDERGYTRQTGMVSIGAEDPDAM